MSASCEKLFSTKYYSYSTKDIYSISWRYILDWSSNLPSIGTIAIFVSDSEAVNPDFPGHDVGGSVVHVTLDVSDALVLSRGGLAVLTLSTHTPWTTNLQFVCPRGLSH